ncbi:PepSY domain-containing protein [uncultured Clostridium sp.]|uniref:PepSY domain-containing protein n=1 Tax=uncultured Clostridium sp. TaxID=59620 RepID=UPI0025E74BF8|nr:PepSY domain-containing protein [uncultured Clostridium sp.]
MKKLLIISSIIVATTSFMACGKVTNNNSSTLIPNNSTAANQNNIIANNASNSTVNSNNKITIEEAKSIALKHSNLDESQVSFIRSEYDFDNGIEKYEIEFYYNNNKYEYEINAKTGDIISYDYDIEKHLTSQQTNDKITIEEAKSIALKHSNLDESQVSFMKAKYEFDDGIGKYEIEFYYNFKEYEYEINASNGEIIKYKMD